MARFLVPLLALLCLLPSLPALHWSGLPSWAGLLSGALIALVWGNPYTERMKGWSGRLLAWSVIGLGAAMDLRVVARTGLEGFGYTLVGLTGTLALGALLMRWLKVRRVTGTLIAVGTAICGGSAIAAAAPVLQAEDEDTSVALGTVFLLNATALMVFPAVGHALHLGERAFGLWAALAIHDTSSVVGASAGYGATALTVATATKLARALWIVPLTLALGAWARRQAPQGAGPGKVKRPWFILGFLASAALVSFLPVLKPAGHLVAETAKRLLVLTLFLLGLGFSREALRKVGLRPLLLGILLWTLAGGLSLGAIRLGWIH